MDRQNEKMILGLQHQHGMRVQSRSPRALPQARIVDVERHPVGRQPRVRFDADSGGFIVQKVLTLEALNHFNLCLGQSFFALVSQAP